jgi:hypothetical protein
MIYVHSLGRASRYYPERKALALGESCLSFRDLERRVTQVAAALKSNASVSAIALPSCFRTALSTSSWCTRAASWGSLQFP